MRRLWVVDLIITPTQKCFGEILKGRNVQNNAWWNLERSLCPWSHIDVIVFKLIILYFSTPRCWKRSIKQSWMDRAERAEWKFSYGRTFIYHGVLCIQLNTSSRGLTHHRVTSCDAIRLRVNWRDAVGPGTLDKRGNLYYYLSYFGCVSWEQAGRVGTMSGLFHAARTYILKKRERERERWRLSPIGAPLYFPIFKPECG